MGPRSAERSLAEGKAASRAVSPAPLPLNPSVARETGCERAWDLPAWPGLALAGTGSESRANPVSCGVFRPRSP